jgi:hypothetical protein
MRLQGGIKSIALGGRHTNTGPIQGVGGTKGANNYAYGDILNVVQTAYNSGTPEQQANWTILAKYTNLPIQRSTDTSLNVRDDILPHDRADGVPAQFVIEEVDCRLYYTQAMITDMNAVWGAAADVAWSGKQCVAGKGFGAQKRAVSVDEKTNEKVEEFTPEPRSFPVKRTENALDFSLWQAKHGRKVPA